MTIADTQLAARNGLGAREIVTTEALLDEIIGNTACGNPHQPRIEVRTRTLHFA